MRLVEDEFLLENSRALVQHRLKSLMKRVDRHRRSGWALELNSHLVEPQSDQGG
jgi:hypothetical protein